MYLPDDSHEFYQTGVQECQPCSRNKPPLQRSKVNDLRADNFGDLAFIDQVYAHMQGQTVNVLIVIDSVVFLPVCARATRESHAPIWCLTELMGTFYCTPNAL